MIMRSTVKEKEKPWAGIPPYLKELFNAIAIGSKPISPITYEGTTRAMSEPNELIAISEPIPRYWPITMF